MILFSGVKKPFISGFTIVRNAVKYDYPVVESITSILSLVDEFIVAVGNSDDNTIDLIKGIGSPKIKIIETIWDDSMREGGKVLAIETDKAFQATSPNADWCFYIQADEVIHEKYHQTILDSCKLYIDNKDVEGLLFKYIHFYGSYDFIGDSRMWYRHEIRIIRKDASIHSYRDAQGFRKNGGKLKVKHIDAYVFHYGWVKDPRSQQAKQENFHKMWHDDEWVKNNVTQADAFDYNTVDSLEIFEGTHPQVMTERLKRMHWHFDFDRSKMNMKFKNKVLHFIEKTTGVRLFEYKNYKVI